MEAKFLSSLYVTLVDKEDQGRWELLTDFHYASAVLGREVVVPKGFVTDFASVPRLPGAYMLVGNVAHEAAVIHDWFYVRASGDEVTRKQADDMLYEAAVLAGLAKWRAWLMWTAVRMFSGKFWKQKEGVQNAVAN